jgi:hypothetical protein
MFHRYLPGGGVGHIEPCNILEDDTADVDDEMEDVQNGDDEFAMHPENVDEDEDEDEDPYGVYGQEYDDEDDEDEEDEEDHSGRSEGDGDLDPEDDDLGIGDW